jgi:ankyrin repeat protein
LSRLARYGDFDPLQTDENGSTALHLACRESHVAIVKLLLAQRNNIAADKIGEIKAVIDKDGKTASQLATNECFAAIVALLEDTITQSDVQCACRDGNLTTVKNLMEKGNTPVASILDKRGWTALHIASFHGHCDIVKYLMEQKQAQLEVTTDDGNQCTALHLAASNGSPEALVVIWYLVELQGANMYALDAKGNTPLDRARQENKTDVVQYLQTKLTALAESPERENAVTKDAE